MILQKINKEYSSPSLRCVRCPKVEINVPRKFTKPSMEPPCWCSSVVHQYGCRKLTLVIWDNDYLRGTNKHSNKPFSKYDNVLNGSKSRDKYIFFDKRDRSFMPRTSITLKFKTRWFPNEGRYGWFAVSRHQK